MGGDINWTIKLGFEILVWMQLIQNSFNLKLSWITILRLGYLDSRKCSPSESFLIFKEGPSTVEMDS